MAKLIETLDEVFAEMKAQTTAIKAMDVLVQTLSDTIAAAIKDSATVAEAATKAEAILAVAKENAAELIAAANVNTPDQTPTDVEVVKEFESLPPQPIDEPETK
jgi:Rod binding domain-containing protein